MAQLTMMKRSAKRWRQRTPDGARWARWARSARPLAGVALIALGGLLGGCATGGAAGEDADARDPFESINRVVHTANEGLDRVLLSPVAKAYLYLPGSLRGAVGNVFGNLGEPKVIINQLLQGKPALAVQDTLRLAINTTLGLGGLIDIATAAGLTKHNEDFAQTLARYGVSEGAYVVFPLLGPGTLLRLPGHIADWFTDASRYVCAGASCTTVLTVLGGVSTRAALDSVIKLQRQAVDPYLFTREAYRQQRRFLLYDGQLPVADDFDDEEFDDDEDADEF